MTNAPCHSQRSLTDLAQSCPCITTIRLRTLLRLWSVVSSFGAVHISSRLSPWRSSDTFEAVGCKNIKGPGGHTRLYKSFRPSAARKPFSTNHLLIAWHLATILKQIKA